MSKTLKIPRETKSIMIVLMLKLKGLSKKIFNEIEFYY